MASLKKKQSSPKLEMNAAEEPNDDESDVDSEPDDDTQTASRVRIITPKVSQEDDGDGGKAVGGGIKATSRVGLTPSNLKRSQSVSRIKVDKSATKIESGEGEQQFSTKVASGSSLKRTQSRVMNPDALANLKRSQSKVINPASLSSLKRSQSKVINPASLSNLKRSQSTLKIGLTAAKSDSEEQNGEETDDTSDLTGVTTVKNRITREPSAEDSYAISGVGEFAGEMSLHEFKGSEMADPKKLKNKLFTLSEITWKEPDTLTQYSSEYGDVDFEDVDISLSSSFPTPRIRTESTERIYLKDDARETYNETHGYTLVEHTEEDGFGKKYSRRFYPRIRQHIKTYKKMLPMKITYNKLTVDETGVVEEEDVINEEMEVEETTNTILVKMRNERGEEITVEKEVMHTNIHDPSVKKKFLKLRMVNDEGEVVEELRPKDKSTSSAGSTTIMGEDEEPGKSVSRLPSLAYADWLKDQNSQKSKLLHKAILNLKKAVDEQKMLKRLNRYLGKKLCQHYDLKGQIDPEFKYNERVGGNNEERKTSYHNKLFELDDVVNFIFSENKMRENWITFSGLNMQKDIDKLSELRQKFYDLEEAMVRDENPTAESLTHRSMTHQDIINQQKLMDANLSKVRLEYTKSQLILNELREKERKFQTSINQLEKVDFINYESMREKTKDLNDKLDLKEKQVMAMKDTITTRVQALANVRLKTEHMSQENDKLKEEKQVIVEELKAVGMSLHHFHNPEDH
ncbi:hypothetical protein GE061_005870 [Apolygus lucorum]|uniref:DUF4201 domain-containing protein n=1 Tax=Apolygus lucorum TaxID=248454 RepID=A0A8S9WXE7_APOLU|nr:hypothetical protein GE061_005870 [Apolygus lucorum]